MTTKIGSTAALTAALAVWVAMSAAALAAASPAGPIPQLKCGTRDHTESGLQGRTTPAERSRGDSAQAYNCNLELVGQVRGEGAKSQGGPAYFGHCAYYGTNNNPAQQHRGVVVIDASYTQHPRLSGYLDDSVMLDPHETLKANGPRTLLAGAQNNGPGFVVYDLSGDCSRPVIKGSLTLPGSQAHMGNFATDGLTYYVGQTNRGVGGFMYIVDLADPSKPKELPKWQYLGDGRPHGVWLNAEGTRLYAGQPGLFGNTTGSSAGPDGLVIEDVSDYQFRRSNPQVRIVSTLFWQDQGQVEEMYPFTMKDRHYIVSTDESGGAAGTGGIDAACARGASAYGYPNIIDITDEKNPRIVARIMLQVNDPANCHLLDEPKDSDGAAPVYNVERCVPDRENNPRMLACTFQNAGLRVFDIRDVSHPIEIAYYKPPAPRTAVLPGSGSWSQGVDRTYDRIAGYPHFNRVAASSANAAGARKAQLELWIVSDGNGFQVLRFTDQFRAAHPDLFEE